MKNIFLCIILLGMACNKPSEDPKADENKLNSVQSNKPIVAKELSWQSPEGWQRQPPSSSMRKDQYQLARSEGDPEDATVVVFYFQGGGGGTEANIERWSGQFLQPGGIPPLR